MFDIVKNNLRFIARLHTMATEVRQEYFENSSNHSLERFERVGDPQARKHKWKGTKPGKRRYKSYQANAKSQFSRVKRNLQPRFDIEGNIDQGSKKRKRRRCKTYNQTGHDKRNCKKQKR